MRQLIVILLVSMVIFAGCRPCKEITRTVIERDTIYTRHDSTIVTPVDSAWIIAFLECDSANRVRIKRLEQKLGEKVQQRIVFRDSFIYVLSYLPESRCRIMWWDLKTSSNTSELTTVVKIKKVYPRWLVALSAIGVIAILYVCIPLVIKLIKLVKPI